MGGLGRPIVGFHRDEHGDWVADLQCGHTVHVRHEPPFFPRPWVLTEEGREARVGTLAPCYECAQQATGGV
ncbi:MAG TPA: DUF3565 domain-containing protein [Candidatus Thermoplasmatota archaeon]|nr:DUF3565 domain-containing protein [Candidatus Thermoplasmatota archaeon]